VKIEIMFNKKPKYTKLEELLLNEVVRLKDVLFAMARIQNVDPTTLETERKDVVSNDLFTLEMQRAMIDEKITRVRNGG